MHLMSEANRILPVGGYFILDVATRDEAVAIASEVPAAEWATVHDTASLTEATHTFRTAGENRTRIEIRRDALPPEAEQLRPEQRGFLRALADGTFPHAQIMRTMNYRLVLADPGHVVFEGETSEDFLNPLGTIHGGWGATLLDSCMACCVHTLLKPGQIFLDVNSASPAAKRRAAKMIEAAKSGKGLDAIKAAMK
mgnify:CR=1 FL=1